MAASLEIVSHSAEETQQIGRILGDTAKPGDIFLLTGPLGSGKTCLTQGIAWGLGVQEYARSPTFVLIARYEGRLTINHMDLFRIDNSFDAENLGLEEYLNSDGVCVVEWADNTPELFPEDSLWVVLDYGVADHDRKLHLYTKGNRHKAHLQSLQESRQCC